MRSIRVLGVFSVRRKLHMLHKYTIWLIGLFLLFLGLKLVGLGNEANIIQWLSGIGMIYALVEWIEHKKVRKEQHQKIDEIHRKVHEDDH